MWRNTLLGGDLRLAVDFTDRKDYTDFLLPVRRINTGVRLEFVARGIKH